jgi:uncharacterized membrane protein
MNGRTTSKEERTVAACSYLTWIAGFWLIGPVAVYLLYREKSRYVAFHAVQAIVVSAGLSILMPVLWVGGMLAVFLLPFALGKSAVPGVMLTGMWAVFAIVLIVPMLWMLLGAWRAFHGERWRVPLAWRVARRFTKDDGLAPHQPSPLDNLRPRGPR